MKWILTCILSLLAMLASAQGKDIKATELLEEVSAKVKACKSVKVDFSYSMQNAKAKINEEKTGSLLISGDKYRMIAAGRIIFSDGKAIWTYTESSNEVQIHSTDDADDAMTPSKLLSSYNANYKSKIIKEKGQEPNIEMIELIPNKQKNITKAILGVDKTKKQVKSFTLFDKNGSIYTYKIIKYQTDVPTEKSDFLFDPGKFPGVDVEDMR
ncbi:MAG: outer membrane lipoprotein carrier protein LolA [bacterium]